MTIRVLIFDFDGLIIDTESAVFQSYQELYRAYGCELSLERWSQGIGTTDTAYDPFGELQASAGGVVYRSTLEARQRKREAKLVAAQPLRPGVLTYLQDAHPLGLMVGLASSSSCAWVVGHLTRLGLLEYFDCIQARDDVSVSKPDPELYRAVLDELKLQPDEALAFEDSPNGIRAARAAGIFTIAVPNAVTRQLPIDGANLRLDSLAEMRLEELLGVAASFHPE